MKKINLKDLAVIVLSIAAIGCMLKGYMGDMVKIKQMEERAHTELIVKNIQENADDWIFFLDGEEVVYDNIDINQYNISCDEEKHKVFLTRK